MVYRWWMGSLVLLCAGAAAAERPNVLFIAVDDLKPLLGCYGTPLVQSPRIDALAARGTVFRNNHCQQAVCAPSRASLLTGLRPDSTRVWDLETQMRDEVPDIRTLPQVLRAFGYETAATGKVFDERAVDDGHDTPSWSVPYVRTGGQRWFGDANGVSTQRAEAPDDDFTDGRIARAGMDLLERLASGDRPFFLAVGFHKPHLPFVAPARDWDRYDRRLFHPHPIQDFAVGTPAFAYQPGWELRNNYTDIPPDGPLPAEQQVTLIHGYYACVSFVDRQVGRLLDRLDALGLRERTVVILWGDHGWHLGDHSLWCKHTNFEQATRSPLIIARPGDPAQATDAVTEFVDLFPTVCDLVGIPQTPGLHGTSLVPLLDDPNTSVKPFAVSQYGRFVAGDRVEGYALRTARYRYVSWVSGFHSTVPFTPSRVVARELYDYRLDPDETVNLVEDPAYADEVASLQADLEGFFASQVDPNLQAETDPSNLLWNPSFDWGTAGWNGNNCTIAVGPDPLGRRRTVVSVTDRQKNWQAVRQSITYVLNEHGPGTYRLSASVRSHSDPALAVKLQVSVQPVGAAKPFYRQARTLAIGPDRWTQLDGTVRLQWSGPVEQAFFHIPTVSGLDGYDADDCLLRFVGP